MGTIQCGVRFVLSEVKEVFRTPGGYIAGVKIGGAVVDGVAPSVRPQELKTIAEAARKTGLQAVIGGPPTGDKSGNRTAEPSVNVIRRLDIGALQCEQIAQVIR